MLSKCFPISLNKYLCRLFVIVKQTILKRFWILSTTQGESDHCSIILSSYTSLASNITDTSVSLETDTTQQSTFQADKAKISQAEKPPYETLKIENASDDEKLVSSKCIGRTDAGKRDREMLRPLESGAPIDETQATTRTRVVTPTHHLHPHHHHTDIAVIQTSHHLHLHIDSKPLVDLEISPMIHTVMIVATQITAINDQIHTALVITMIGIGIHHVALSMDRCRML